ncbi:hypothetical protein AS203_00870 [Hoylesella enoeca]|uniref:Uncharacterized protein n=1 Tax=Hoylesella enoeca TaxID=76123 RepID=A0A0S2KHM8_9BACT|nr:hypothetical protein AS203_00870 [Hoylesella enoeca]
MKNNVSAPTDGAKIGKIALRQVPKTRKSKKQSFGTCRRSENRENTFSAGAESRKNSKRTLRHPPKSKKLKKHAVGRCRKTKNQKDNL